MIRLGFRLAVAGGRGSIAGVALTAFAVALGTAILLFALSLGPALQDRMARAAWRQPDQSTIVLAPSGEPSTTSGLMMQVIPDRFGAEPLIRVHVAALEKSAPTPPGIDRIPAPGEAFVSPALAARMATVPPDQLGDRIGRIVGTIGDAALRSPQELVAIIGTEPAVMQANGAVPIQAFRTTPKALDLPPIVILMIILAVAGALAPVAVFVATATRLSAARREQRLAALRLIGATPRQVAVLAIVEALVPTVIGAVAGIALFLLVRPLIALMPLDEATWFPDAIRPPLSDAAALILAVPVVGALAAAITLRRLVVTPLGVRQRVTPPPPRVTRLLPLALSVAVLLGTLGVFRSSAIDGAGSMVLLGLAFAGIVGGIAYAGPWLTALVGRALHRWPGGAATLLASRRLTDDPRASFGSIAGVIMAVYVASVFFTFAAYARAQSSSGADVAADRLVHVGLPSTHLPDGAAVTARLEAAPGVRSVMAVGEAELLVNGSPMSAWVVPCQRVVDAAQLPGVTCGTASIHQFYGGEIRPATYLLAPDREALDGRRVAVKLRVRSGDVAQSSPEGRFQGMGGLSLPNMLIEPSALGANVAAIPIGAMAVTTDGSNEAIERIRTIAASAAPTSRVVTGFVSSQTEAIFAEFGRIVQLGLLCTLILAGCSLAVAVTTGVLERRRQFTLLRSAGMPVSGLRRSLLLQAGVPLLTVALFSALLGIGVSQAVLRLSNAPVVPMPDASLAVTLLASLAAALVIVALTFPPLERLTRPDSVRLE